MYGNNKNDHHVEASRHYPVMKKDDICRLPICNISDNDCALFMWVTDSNLDEAIEVMKSWGFKYKTVAFIWQKKEKSGKQVCFMGCWTMKNCELVLLGTKGSMSKYLVSRKVRQLQPAIRERNVHSRKPNLIREKIVEMFGDISRIELFARQRVEGWDAWGNGIEESPVLGEETPRRTLWKFAIQHLTAPWLPFARVALAMVSVLMSQGGFSVQAAVVRANSTSSAGRWFPCFS